MEGYLVNQQLVGALIRHSSRQSSTHKAANEAGKCTFRSKTDPAVLLKHIYAWVS
jgi:hypothetical protein